MSRDDGTGGFAGLIGVVIGVVMFLIFAWSTYYTIDQGERGVILHNGAVEAESEPGLHFKYPFVTDVVKISIQQQNDAFEKSDQGDWRMIVYTEDQQPATVSLSILYRATDVSTVYSNYGSLDGVEKRLIDPKAQEQVKNVFGQFTAISAIQDRARLTAQITNAVRAAIKGPITIDSVQITDISFSQQYENAVEARMQAIIAQERAVAEKQQRITNADAAAYEVKAAADAQAHATQVNGEAQAAAIKARGDALRDNPNLVALTTAEKWNGELPSTMVPGAGLPLLQLK